MAVWKVEHFYRKKGLILLAASSTQITNAIEKGKVVPIFTDSQKLTDLIKIIHYYTFYCKIVLTNKFFIYMSSKLQFYSARKERLLLWLKDPKRKTKAKGSFLYGLSSFSSSSSSAHFSVSSNFLAFIKAYSVPLKASSKNICWDQLRKVLIIVF